LKTLLKEGFQSLLIRRLWERALTLNDLLQIALIVSTVLLALLTVELKDMLHAVICLCGMCVAIGALFWLLNAPYVSLFQLLVYAGAVIVLFIATVMLTARKEKPQNENRLG
jgi:NADH:ubiquinone oxidoreductase subunit 6 (subunit J)